MSKYSYEEKLQGVLRVTDEGMSLGDSVRITGTVKEHVRGWVMRYNEFGEEGLLMKHGAYDGAFTISVFDGTPRSTFYYYFKRMKQLDKYVELKEIIKQIFNENKGRCGYHRITIELDHRGYHVNHKTVQKLMKQCGLKCEIRIKKSFLQRLSG